MSAFDDFVYDHRTAPWPDLNLAYEGAPATALYDVYKAEMDAQDRKVLSQPEFGAALKAAGYQVCKVESGRVYPGLTIETRMERATKATLTHLCYLTRTWEEEAADREHRGRKHADGSLCQHRPPPEVTEGINERTNAEMARYETDGTVEAVRFQRYGMWLRPILTGDPDIGLLARWSALRKERDQLLAVFPIVQAAAQAELPTKPELRSLNEVMDDPAVKGTGRSMLDVISSHVEWKRLTGESSPEYQAWKAAETAKRDAERALADTTKRLDQIMSAMVTVSDIIHGDTIPKVENPDQGDQIDQSGDDEW